MPSSVSISSVNYNGNLGNITFLPSTGGTINLGAQNIPYTYVTNYPYGTYNIYFPAYNNTCTTIITAPTSIPLTIYAKSYGCVLGGYPTYTQGVYRINRGPWISLTNNLMSTQTTYAQQSIISSNFGDIIDICYPGRLFGLGYISSIRGAGDWNSHISYQYVSITVTMPGNVYFNLETA